MQTKTRVYLSALALVSTVSTLLPAVAQTQTPLPAAPPTQTAPAKPAASLANPAMKWESEIAAFEAKDKKTPPPKNPILFTGSSSIRKWTSLQKDFPNVPVLNRGFGGSVTSDSVYFVDRIVLPYHPRKIVFYAGDNDLAGKKSPQTVANDWKAFVEKVRTALPDVPLVYIAIKPSVSRWKIHAKQEAANRLIEGYCKTQKGIDFVDVYHPMLGANGEPMPDLFLADKLHMTPKGYAIWTKVLAPYIQ